MLVLTLAFTGVSCSREDIRTDVNLSKLKPGEVSVGISLDALTLPVGNEGEIRALTMTMNNSTHNGKPSYGVVKMNRQAATTISSVGVFYCPKDPTGKKVYYTDPAKPMTWELVKANADKPSKPLLYQCTQSNIVNIPKSLLDGTHDWYFMGVVGAKQATDGTLTFKPSEDNTASGFDYQGNGSSFNLDVPMTSGWVKINLKVRPDDLLGHGGGTEPYFYPENWELKPVGNGSKGEPTIKFKPRGTLFRILVTNKANYNLKITDINLRSNVMAFDASITPESIRALNVPTPGQAMPLKHGATNDVLLDVRDNLVSETQNETNNPGAILAWGLVNEKLYKEVDAEYKANPVKRFPYFAVRASAYPTDNDMWTSAEKQSDYFPVKKRASAVSGKPVFLTKVDNISTMYRDGGQQWLSVTITSSLSNLELMNFEPIASDGDGTRFKASHPFLNRHSDISLYWLDQVAFPDYNKTLDWITRGDFFSREDDRDITSNPRSRGVLSSTTNNVKYHLPYKEEILEFLPMPKGEHGHYSNLVNITNTSGYHEIETDVVEPTYNLKHNLSANKIQTAVHHLRLGSADKANMNYMKDLKTKQALTTLDEGDYGDAYREDMSQFNLFNYFWHKRVVYSLAYLRKGDPESLVAFRYAWVSSPNDASGLAANESNLPRWFWDHGNADFVLTPDFIAKAKAASRPYSEDILKVIREVSTWSPGRPQADGFGRAMVSAFVVAMKPIGAFDDRVRSINDLDAVAQESFWTENPKSLVFRIFPAVGFSSLLSTNNPGAAVNRNRGVYLMTKDVPTGGEQGKDFYYFYVGLEGWGLFNTKDSEMLNEEYRLTKKNTTFSGYDTSEKQQAKFTRDFTESDWADDYKSVFNRNQYYIHRVFPKGGAGIPARFMVGPSLDKPTR